MAPLRIATVFLENFREHHRKPPQSNRKMFSFQLASFKLPCWKILNLCFFVPPSAIEPIPTPPRSQEHHRYRWRLGRSHRTSLRWFLARCCQLRGHLLLGEEGDLSHHSGREREIYIYIDIYISERYIYRHIDIINITYCTGYYYDMYSYTWEAKHWKSHNGQLELSPIKPFQMLAPIHPSM